MMHYSRKAEIIYLGSKMNEKEKAKCFAHAMVRQCLYTQENVEFQAQNKFLIEGNAGNYTVRGYFVSAGIRTNCL